MSGVIPPHFQPLTEGDTEQYGTPPIIELAPPSTEDPVASERRANWLEWRAASYAADRHSEYLAFREEASPPKILLSAILRTPSDLETYFASIPRKQRYYARAAVAQREGYTTESIEPADHGRAIHAIVHSVDDRQGRPITSMFAERSPNHGFPLYRACSDPSYECVCSGVFAPDGILVAYLLGMRVGDHVQYDEIMGHQDHLSQGVMYLLHRGFLEQAIALEVTPRFLNYGPWYSGRDPFSPKSGLNLWKRRLQFEPAYLMLASS